MSSPIPSDRYQYPNGAPPSRAMFVTLGEREVVARCKNETVGISSIESLPQGGTRLVCMSSDGAATMRKVFKSHMVKGDPVRQIHRPAHPTW